MTVAAVVRAGTPDFLVAAGGFIACKSSAGQAVPAQDPSFCGRQRRRKIHVYSSSAAAEQSPCKGGR